MVAGTDCGGGGERAVVLLGAYSRRYNIMVTMAVPPVRSDVRFHANDKTRFSVKPQNGSSVYAS